MNTLVVALLVGMMSTVAVFAGSQPAGEGQSLLRRYVGTNETDQLLREPWVKIELGRLLGSQRQHLERNLDVRGAVDLIGGHLSVSGNAPHQGTEEEGVVCIGTYKIEVHAAIYSRGEVSVFTRAEKYESLPICVKDWITQVSSGHRDRLTQPKNVQVVIRK